MKMLNEMIEKTITIPRYTVEFDEYASAPDYCSAAPTIYGRGWWNPSPYPEEPTSCGCNEVIAPSWESINEALNRYGETIDELQCSDSQTAKHLKHFYGVEKMQLLSSEVDPSEWAIVLDTTSWREHIGIDLADKGEEGNSDAQSYLNGDVYRVTDELTGDSLSGIYADNEAEALQIAKWHFGTDQEGNQ